METLRSPERDTCSTQEMQIYILLFRSLLSCNSCLRKYRKKYALEHILVTPLGSVGSTWGVQDDTDPAWYELFYREGVTRAGASVGLLVEWQNSTPKP